MSRNVSPDSWAATIAITSSRSAASFRARACRTSLKCDFATARDSSQPTSEGSAVRQARQVPEGCPLATNHAKCADPFLMNPCSRGHSFLRFSAQNHRTKASLHDFLGPANAAVRSGEEGRLENIQRLRRARMGWRRVHLGRAARLIRGGTQPGRSDLHDYPIL